MLAWLRSWRGGLVVSVTCLAAGLLRAFAVRGDGESSWLTPALLVLALAYACAAFIDRRTLAAPRERRDPNPVARPAGSQGRVSVPHTGLTPAGDVASSTRDRVGAALAIAAAVVGLVLVFSGREPGASADDHGPVAPSAGQIVPAPDGERPPPALDPAP